MEAGDRPKLVCDDSDAEACPHLPDEALLCLVDHSCEFLQDQLAFSLLSKQHRKVVEDKLSTIATARRSTTGSLLEQGSFADYFVNWSLISFGASAKYITDVESSQSALSFYCKGCRNLIITQNEVESPHYHGGHGPAFLAHCVFNCHHSPEEAYETQFTTGVYKVCDVTCLRCGSRVGKKYVEARDPGNYFKVGKILLEQTLLTMPKCCNLRKLNAFPPEHYYCARESGVSCFCSVCLQDVRATAATAAIAMTRSLDPKHVVRLYSLLQAERQIFTCEPTLSDECSSPGSISQRFGHALSRFIGKSTALSPSSATSCGADLPDVSLTASITGSSILKGRLQEDQLLVLSQCVGERLAMLPDSQNWIVSTKVVGDLVAAAARHPMLVTAGGIAGVHLNRAALMESLVTHCGAVSFRSATLLLSRLAGADDRRAVVAGLTRNPMNVLTGPELDSLGQLGGGISSPSSGRWSSFSAGSASFTSH